MKRYYFPNELNGTQGVVPPCFSSGCRVSSRTRNNFLISHTCIGIQLVALNRLLQNCYSIFFSMVSPHPWATPKVNYICQRRIRSVQKKTESIYFKCSVDIFIVFVPFVLLCIFCIACRTWLPTGLWLLMRKSWCGSQHQVATNLGMQNICPSISLKSS